MHVPAPTLLFLMKLKNDLTWTELSGAEPQSTLLPSSSEAVGRGDQWARVPVACGFPCPCGTVSA